MKRNFGVKWSTAIPALQKADEFLNLKLWENMQQISKK